jgi:hypothetical protein
VKVFWRLITGKRFTSLLAKPSHSGFACCGWLVTLGPSCGGKLQFSEGAKVSTSKGGGDDLSHSLLLSHVVVSEWSARIVQALPKVSRLGEFHKGSWLFQWRSLCVLRALLCLYLGAAR